MRDSKHTFVVDVDDKPGVLNRVVSLFRRRSFNIESLAVGRTEVPGKSRMVIFVNTDAHRARLLHANLCHLVPVRRAEDITDLSSVMSDHALIKVAAVGVARTDVIHLVGVYRARVVDVSPDSLIIEVTGTETKIDSLISVLRPFGVIEMVRTGRIAMVRGITKITRHAAPTIDDLITDDLSNCSV